MSETPLIERVEDLEDALCDILDFTSGFCRRMPDVEKLALIHKIAEKALEADRG